MTTTLDRAMRWGRANSIFPATFGLACCAIEMMSIVSPRYDIARFGAENMRASPRQADMLILSGRVSIKMAPVVRRLYDQMLEPKWVISMGACSSSGGMFANYAVVQGADKFMPVDIHVPGCPPRPGGAPVRVQQAPADDPRQPGSGLAPPLQRDRHRGVGPARHRHRVEGGGRGVRRRPGASRSPDDAELAGESALMPDAPGLELIAQDLDEPRAGSVLGTYHEHGQACLIVDPEQILDCSRWLRDTPGQEYRFLASLHGVDYLPAEPRFGVVYELLEHAAGRAAAGPRGARRPRRRTSCLRSTAASRSSPPPSSRSARSTTSSASSSAATPTCAAS